MQRLTFIFGLRSHNGRQRILFGFTITTVFSTFIKFLSLLKQKIICTISLNCLTYWGISLDNTRRVLSCLQKFYFNYQKCGKYHKLNVNFHTTIDNFTLTAGQHLQISNFSTPLEAWITTSDLR